MASPPVSADSIVLTEAKGRTRKSLNGSLNGPARSNATAQSKQARTVPRRNAGVSAPNGSVPSIQEERAILGAVDSTVLLEALARIHGGDFTARMPVEWTGVAGKVADGINDVIVASQVLESELARISDVVGQQGRLSQRMTISGPGQSWNRSVDSVNTLIEALVRPTTEMQRVIGAVADGDLSKKITADVRGETLDLKNTINAMVDQLNGFVSELTRVA